MRAQDAQEAIAGSSFRIQGGVIVNRAFSNISEKVEIIDDFTRITRTPSDSAGNVKTGFIIGCEALTKGKKVKGAFGLSFARSEAVYHSSFTEEGRTTRPGFTHMKRATELDYVESYFYLDLHAGVRVHAANGFYVTGGLAFNRPLSAKRQSEGYILTTYSTEGAPETETTIAFLEDPNKKVKGDSNLSLRLRAEYEFDVGDSKGAVFLFRNFGFIYTLPWWGIGFSYSLN